MTQIHLALDGYLLTGDARQQTKLKVEAANLAELFDRAKLKAPTEFLRDVLSRLDVSQRNWTEKFARPLVAARQRVDSGNATVAELQILFAEQDPTSWSDTSAAVRDDANWRSARRSTNRWPRRRGRRRSPGR